MELLDGGGRKVVERKEVRSRAAQHSCVWTGRPASLHASGRRLQAGSATSGGGVVAEDNIGGIPLQLLAFTYSTREKRCVCEMSFRGLQQQTALRRGLARPGGSMAGHLGEEERITHFQEYGVLVYIECESPSCCLQPRKYIQTDVLSPIIFPETIIISRSCTESMCCEGWCIRRVDLHTFSAPRRRGIGVRV